MTIFEQLAAPFPPERISWRVGSITKDKTKGMALAYIDARDVMERLDTVVGENNWSTSITPLWTGAVSCTLSIRIDGEWIAKSDMAGATGDIQDEREREMATKGAASDALKRAAVQWGIGRYLYDVDAPWVELDEYKRIKKHEYARLQSILPGAVRQLPKKDARKSYSDLSLGLKRCGTLEMLQEFWLSNKDAIAALPPDWKRDLIQEKNDIKGLLEARAA